MILRKVLFYGFLVFSSLSIGLYSLNLWIRNRRDSVSRCFATATLAFSLFASRELLRMSGISHVTIFYASMDAAYFLMKMCIRDSLSFAFLKKWINAVHRPKLH